MVPLASTVPKPKANVSIIDRTKKIILILEILYMLVPRYDFFFLELLDLMLLLVNVIRLGALCRKDDTIHPFPFKPANRYPNRLERRIHTKHFLPLEACARANVVDGKLSPQVLPLLLRLPL